MKKIGMVGCGNISGAYFNHCAPYKNIKIVKVADMDEARAKAVAAERGIQAVPLDAIYTDPDIDIILNLTIPQAHKEVNLKAIAAGKHAYCEKPFALTIADAKETLAAAKAKKVLTGCAPDTVLGGGIQTARKLIDDGVIGDLIGSTAFMMCRGHESWHPSPVFYYKKGGGPMLDMGPYYVTALVTLLGPIARISGSTRMSFPTRTITSEPLNGTIIEVETPTHLAGTIDFQCGAVGTIITSFDVVGHQLPRIEVYGSKGTLSVPDPNTFAGEVKLLRQGTKEWEVMPHTHNIEIGRGTGVSDLAACIGKRRKPRASGELATHVLEAMLAFEQSSVSGKHVKLKSKCLKPVAMKAGMQKGEMD
jgi:predicted dehydrogenase